MGFLACRCGVKLILQLAKQAHIVHYTFFLNHSIVFNFQNGNTVYLYFFTSGFDSENLSTFMKQLM